MVRVPAGPSALSYWPASFPVGIELFVYTSAELAELRTAGAGFIRVIDQEVRWL